MNVRIVLIVSLALFSLFASFSVRAQESEPAIGQITTVNDVKRLMAETFEGIEDYTAQIRWKNGDTEYLGTMRYKKENKFTIEFEVPEDQVIVSNGEYLYLYIPYLKVVIQQSLKETTESEILTGTTEAGLFKLFDEYSFSFFDTSRPQPFENERAYHLKLFQKRPKVGFKTMDLWVSDEGLILQSNGRSPNGFDVSLTFSDIEINTELPDYIFEFEVPADAQIMRNTIVPFSDNL